MSSTPCEMCRRSGHFKRRTVHGKRSPHSDCRLSTVIGSRVTVVTAFDPLPRYLGDEEMASLAGRAVAHCQDIAAEAADLLRAAGVRTEIDVLEGPAAQAILRAASTRGADLIVVGSRGLGDLQAALLGSVSHKVLQIAEVPVLVVR